MGTQGVARRRGHGFTAVARRPAVATRLTVTAWRVSVQAVGCDDDGSAVTRRRQRRWHAAPGSAGMSSKGGQQRTVAAAAAAGRPTTGMPRPANHLRSIDAIACIWLIFASPASPRFCLLLHTRPFLLHYTHHNRNFFFSEKTSLSCNTPPSHALWPCCTSPATSHAPLRCVSRTVAMSDEAPKSPPTEVRKARARSIWPLLLLLLLLLPLTAVISSPHF